LGTAVGLEMFKMTSEVDYGAMVMAKGKYFLEGLQDLQKRFPIIGDVDGLGLALRCEICGPDGFAPDKATLDYMVEEGMKGDMVVDGQKLGLILDVGGYYKNVITLAPSLEISYPEIDLGLKLLEQLLVRATTR
jgi:4-aminobutyrate aminotransferase-like enzyme